MARNLKTEYVSFTERKHHTVYVADRFSSLLQGSVLDVGCDQALLKEYLPPNSEYYGIDIMGEAADLLLNLDEIERLPFDEGSFDTVLCTDVLEHLDHFHLLFDEIIRISKKWTILSLPNCWLHARRPIARGKGAFAYYGLPVDPPDDRHRWFFNVSEINTFMEEQAQRKNLKIYDMHLSEKSRPAPLRWLRRLRYPKKIHYFNRYAHTVWTVLEKIE